MNNIVTLPSVLEEPLRLDIQPGQSLTELMEAAEVPRAIWDRVVLFLNGGVVNDWDNVYTQDGDTVVVAVIPAGGGDEAKGILASLAMIAISLAAGPLASVIAPGLAKGSIGFHALTAGITLVGSLAVSALIKPPTPGPAEASSTPSAEAAAYAFSGQSNQAKIYGTVPRIFGRTRFYPYLMGTPRVDNVGKTSRVSAMYDWGVGNLQLSDIRVGNLDIGFLQPQLSIHQNSLGTQLDLVHKQTAYEDFSLRLEKNVPFTVRTKDASISATLDINFPSGLTQLDKNGDRRAHTVPFAIRYREQGTANWVAVPASDFHGAWNNPQQWIWRAEYGVNPGGESGSDYWSTRSIPFKKGTHHELMIIHDHRIILSNGRENNPFDENERWINGRPYRRGTLRDSQPMGSNREATVTSYELLIPEAPPSNAVQISEATTIPFTLAVNLNFPKPAVYDIEIQRLTAPSIAEADLHSLRDVAVVTLLKSYRAGKVLNLRKPHTFAEVAFIANDKVSGVIDTLNAVAHSILRTVTATGWGPAQVSSNPALAALELLTGASARKPLRDEQIDFASWHRLMTLCNAKITQTVNGITYTAAKYEFNGVIEDNIPMRDALQQILSPARAQVSFMVNGKLGVLIDEEKFGYRQLLTPENTYGFEGTRSFVDLPDALRVEFLDEESDWEPREVMVYRDGFSELTAVKVENLRASGVTSFPEAYRYGRFMIAQGIMRSEQFTLSMDVENLAVQRGDRVAVLHDVPRFGGMSFRVVSVTGNTVELDRPLELSDGGYVVRRLDGVVRQGRIIRQTDINSWEFDTAMDLGPDDLVALGSTQEVVRDYLVQSIDAGEDLTARLTLVAYDPRVYTADTGPLPPWDPGFGGDLIGETQVAIKLGDVTSSWNYRGRVPHLRVTIPWEVVAGHTAYANAQLLFQVGVDASSTLARAETDDRSYSFEIPWSDKKWFDEDIQITVVPVSGLGIEGQAQSTKARFPAYAVVPGPPRNTFLDVRSQEVAIFWDRSDSPDVTEYAIRYTPDLVAPQWNACSDLGRASWDATAFATGARTGSYLLVAQNVAGFTSTPVVLRTTVEQLPDMNVVDLIDESAVWPGDLINFTKGYSSTLLSLLVRRLDKTLVAAALPAGVLKPEVKKLDGTLVSVLNSVGISSDILVSNAAWDINRSQRAIYQFKEALDLGEIYEVRIGNKLRVAAVDITKLIGPLDPSHIPTLPAESDENWNGWLEYRTADKVAFIHSWTSLRDVKSMALAGAAFSPWRKVNVGDATGRRFQFRFVAEALNPDLAILLFGGFIEVDMPDRTWRMDNVAVPLGSKTITFSPAFREKPVVAVTIEGVTAAVRHEITNLTRLSMDIRLLNAAGAAVAGQVDIAALGYGRERGAII